jgi:endoglucanase
MKRNWNRHLRHSRAIFALIGCLAWLAVPARGQGTGYWHTSGNQILDSNNQPVRMAGVNWYGFETTDAVIHGLWAKDYKAILTTIKNNGYNVVRIPFSNQMVESNPVPTNISFNNGSPINTDLQGLTSLQILDKIVAFAGSIGLRVILDNHRSEAGNSAEANGLWFTSAFPESAWINDWVALSNRYLNNTTVIGMDLRNEPHNSTSGGACWGCGTANDWRLAAQRAGNAVLNVNPHLLIFVEGTDCFNGDCNWWGGNLEGVSQFPVVLNVSNQLVYSAHDYGPALFQQSWFNSNTTAASLQAHWTTQWAYIYNNKTAPLWVGEFGTGNGAADVQNTAAGSEGQWFSSLVQFLGANPAMNWTYWALNGEDSFAILNSNYDATPANATKQQLLAGIQFPLGGAGGGSPAPTITSISPASALPGASITITGTNFSTTANANIVTFGTAGGTVTAATTTSLTVTVPNIAAGSVNVTVAVAGKTSNAVNFTVSSSGGGGGSCHVVYSIVNQWNTGFQVAITIANTGTTALTSWTLVWSFPGNQQIANLWNGAATQSGTSVTVNNLSYNGNIPAGGSYNGMGFVANGAAATPASFSVNGVRCQ